jgi:hypothetical protein
MELVFCDFFWTCAGRMGGRKKNNPQRPRDVVAEDALSSALGQWAVFGPAVQEPVALRQHSRAKTKVLRNSIECCGAVI